MLLVIIVNENFIWRIIIGMRMKKCAKNREIFQSLDVLRIRIFIYSIMLWLWINTRYASQRKIENPVLNKKEIKIN